MSAGQRVAAFGLLAVSAWAAPAAAQGAPCVGGVATLNGVSYSCSGIDLAGVLSPQALGAPPAGQCPNPYPAICANDVWAWVDGGREIALVGLPNGVAFVDVTDGVLRPLGRLPSATAASPWRGVKVAGEFAYVVSEAQEHGMQIFDLRRLRGLAPDAGRLFTADARYTGFGSAHNIVATPGRPYVYATGMRSASGLPAACAPRGLHAVDVSNPLVPAFAACFSDAAQDSGPVIAPGYTHDAQCLVYDGPDAAYTGRELCFASNENEVTIFDVTDKAAVRIVSQVSYPGHAYTHQGWLTADRRYFLVNDELDERNGITPTQKTFVLDVSSLDQPSFAFVYDSGLPVIDHNLFIRGRYMFQSNYEAGLRVVDVGRVAEGVLTEIAHFDTYPQGQGLLFNGSWGNYPFLPSGRILVADTRNGLFVLQPRAFTVGAEPAPEGASGGALSPPTPNPAGTQARFTLRVDTPQDVRAELFDAAGRRVAEVFAGPVSGAAELRADVAGLPAGVYVLRVSGPGVRLAQPVTVAR